MKKIALAAALAGFASTAFAGSPEPAMVEMAPVVVMEETAASSSSAGLIIPLVLLALLAAAASSSD